MNENTSFAENILTRGYAHLPLCVDKDTLGRAVKHFLFIANSHHAYTAWALQRDKDKEPDTGRIDRRGTRTEDGKQGDRKVFFHYDGHDVPVMLLARGEVFSYKDRRFFTDCKVIYDALKTEAISRVHELFCATSDEKAKTLCDFFPTDSSGRETCPAVLRFLAYMETREDAEGIVGREHIDRGGLTFAVRESGPGLELQSKNGLWIPDSPQEDTMIAFPGGKLKTLTSDSNIPIEPTWHQVRGHENRVSDTVIRWSVVFFLHPVGDVAFAATHR